MRNSCGTATCVAPGAPTTVGGAPRPAETRTAETRADEGARIDPKTDGRPDSRPDVRENASILGNLMSDFDFTQTPRPPMVLPEQPKPGPASMPGP